MLAVLAYGLIATLAACGNTPDATVPARPTPAPTWTPTVTARPATPTRARPTQPAQQPTATPLPSPAPQATATRVDAAGPKPVATIAPLPPGQGRSPVRIRIPAVGLDAPVQPMSWQVVGDHSEWQVPANAAGHHIDSAFPGESGNVVISGHHNMAGSVFAPISAIGEPGNALGLGDEVILEDELGRRFVYQITGWRRLTETDADIAIRKENASYLLPTDFPQLTLITCWPATSNTHRVIIQAALTEIRTP